MTKQKKSAKFVSRGGDKLEGAINEFKLNPKGKVCFDIGSSTGGFTDLLLQKDAKRVYCVDVGYGLLDWKLRSDPRVIALERTNIKDLKTLPEAADLVVIDVSFISLSKVLPVLKGWAKKKHFDVVALIKPQFEATEKEASVNKGVIKDEKIHLRVLQEIKSSAASLGFELKGTSLSPIEGAKGNKEFFIWLYI